MSHDKVGPEKLTGSPPPPAEHGDHNRKIVKTVYKAMRDDDTEKLGKMVGTEMEWWYHGPRHCQYMMEMLTGGESTNNNNKGFKFRPRRMRAINGDRVIVEGWEGMGEYWVHLWRLKDGIVVQLREYFNTLLTVVLRRDSEGGGDEARAWRSTSRARVHGSLPDLVLAI